MYNGTFDFECICGELLHGRQMIFAHTALHSIKSGIPDITGMIQLEEMESKSDECVGPPREPSEIVEDVDIMLPAEDKASAADEDDNYSLCDLDVMFHQFVDINGDEEKEEESSDSEVGDDVSGDGRDSFHSTVVLTQLNNRSQYMWNHLQLYRFCIEQNITVKGYRQLRKLPVFESCHDIPLNLKHLRRKVERYIEETFNWPPKRIATIAGNDTPYMSIDDCLAVWLAVPCIVNAVRDWRQKYLPLNLVEVGAYETLFVDRSARIAMGTYSYETVADGAFYLENVRDAIPLFEEEYLRAVDDDIEVLICTVGLYEDNFGKNLNSLISQTLFCTTLSRNLC